MLDVAPAVCPSCGAPREAKFCNQCGEKRITTHDFSLVHFGEALLESFTHFDFRSLRAIKVLFTQPGELTRSYLIGRRRAFVGPIQLFIIINVVFALIGGKAFKTPLGTQEHDWPFRQMKRVMVADAIEHGQVTRTEFEKEFDRNAGTQSKTWIFAMIPGFALCLALVYGFRRYYFEHLVFATHFYAFQMLFLLASSVVVGLALLAAGISPNGHDILLSLIALAGLIVYLYLALRRAYGDGKVAAAVRALFLGACIYPVLIAYRFLLFFVTLKTMH